MDTHLEDFWGPAESWPGVSIVLPILNEERHLDDAITAILGQDYPGEYEVILALGPSRDKTNEIAARLSLRDSRVRLVENPTGRTAAGLNAAIALSRYPLITRIDGHAEVSKSYVRDAVRILRTTGAVNAGGIMAAQGQTLFERAVATAMRSPLGVGASRFHTGGGAGESDTVYLGNFVKSAIVAAGGYDERYTRAQDWELNFRLRKNGGVIWFDPSLVVTYRPRSSITALAKQYFEYGRWRHAVARSHKGSVNYRYLAPPTALAINALSIILGATISPYFFIPVITYSAAVLAGAAIIGKSVGEKFFLPAILATMHMSWGAGYLTSPPGLIAEDGEE
jgi:glycosyltransferase involved in cell wall biosynthesis